MEATLEAVVIKGTRHGLLVCVREDPDFNRVLSDLRERFAGDSGFLRGASVSVDLGWREMSDAQFADLEAVLGEHSVKMVGVLSTSLNTRTLAEARGYKAIIGRLGLAQHQGRAIRRQAAQAPTQAPSAVESAPAEEIPAAASVAVDPGPAPQAPAPPAESADRDQEDTLYLRRTLRSGQRALYPGNVVVIGDVNPGAEIEAEGDILIFGHLRGKVHAGCTGNQQAQVMALGMAPTQLRIADHVWAAEANPRKQKSPGSQRALVRDGQIQMEPITIR